MEVHHVLGLFAAVTPQRCLSEAMERWLGLEQQKWVGSSADQKGLKDLNGEFWSKND